MYFAGSNQKGMGTQQPIIRQAALNNTVQITRFTPRHRLDILMALSDSESRIKTELTRALAKHLGIKWYIVLTARYTKQRDSGEWITNEQMFASSAVALLEETAIADQLAAAFQQVFANAQTFEAEGSGWSLEEIEHVAVQTVAYQPLQASSYIPLPSYIKHKKAVVNVINYDKRCLLWSLLACLYPATYSRERLSHYVRYKDKLDMRGVTFPTPIAQIGTIEKNNNLSINVFGYDEDDKVYPLRISSQIREKHVNVLYITNEETSHYCWIREFSRLMGNRTKHKGKLFYCYNCLHGFVKKERLDEHKESCYKQRTQRIKFPAETTVRFKSIQRQLRAPFIIYADFECYTTRIHTCVNNPKQSSSTPYQHHIPSGFSYVVVSAADRFTQPVVVYRGENVVDTFLDYLTQTTHQIFRVLEKPQDMIMTEEQKQEFEVAQYCHICDKWLGEDRVRDHDHLTGNYRGAAHNECNLAYHFEHRLGRRTTGTTGNPDQQKNRKSMEYVIPVVFHNLRGYDGHLLMSGIGRYKSRRIKCIPNNAERYLSVSLGCLRFIDSYQFMAASLDKLVANLESEHFYQMRRNIQSPTRQRLLLRKGVYPYDYVDCAKRLKETSLPSKECFFSELVQESITDEDYEHAKAVWREFNCKTLGDYHDVYLKADVLLLADVFERFRTTSLDTYKLDPAHYFTSPGLAWDAMLRYTGIKLQLLTDPDMVLMIERGIRGGVSMITKKHAQANNPYNAETYDRSKPNTYLMYYDANNLYGWAMSESMPEKDFAWCTQQELDNLDVTRLDKDSTTGYFLEVDLDYPPELHDLHSDYPLAPEQLQIVPDELSPYTQRLRATLKLSDRPQTKLVPTLHPKRRYVVHYQALQLYLRLGISLVKIHRALRFTQSRWLQPYIALNTEKRKQSTNAFEKDFFKLMNNSVFGKTMENVRGRINLELVHSKRRMKKLSCKPTFHRLLTFNKDLVAVQCLKTVLCLDKPIYVGCTILDVSKTLMYWFHYEHIKQKYSNRAQLYFTDTDSLLYEFHGVEDIYRDMLEDSHLFDTSDYPTDHPLHSNANKKVLGKMKDEMSGKAIDEFVGLRSKMYSILCGVIEKKTAKGVKRSTIKHELRHLMYREVLLNEKCTVLPMRSIRSRLHQVYSVLMHKQALSPYDDKRYVLDDRVSTRAFGHRLNVIHDDQM